MHDGTLFCIQTESSSSMACSSHENAFLASGSFKQGDYALSYCPNRTRTWIDSRSWNRQQFEENQSALKKKGVMALLCQCGSAIWKWASLASDTRIGNCEIPPAIAHPELGSRRANNGREAAVPEERMTARHLDNCLKTHHFSWTWWLQWSRSTWIQAVGPDRIVRLNSANIGVRCVEIVKDGEKIIEAKCEKVNTEDRQALAFIYRVSAENTF
jgi:hypothetical protein